MTRRLIILIAIVLLLGFIERRDNPTVEQKPIERTWTKMDSKAYARGMLYDWTEKQYQCLNKLWTKESNWRPNAYNKTKVMGKNAGGIPQILGLSPDLPPTIQIDRGLEYIKYRYGTPCRAWYVHERKGWY
jgi:hypothetical protein